MSDWVSSLERLSKNPLMLIIVIGSGLSYAYLQYVAPENAKQNKSSLDIQVDAEQRIAKAQAQLDAMMNQERVDIRDFMQQLINTYTVEAWVKYLDYSDQSFKIMVINRIYSDKYGTPFLPYGKSDVELYENIDLTPDQRADLLEYAVNDRKAIVAGVGRCAVFVEKAFPVKESSPVYLEFKKCMLRYGSQTYVFGVLNE